MSDGPHIIDLGLARRLRQSNEDWLSKQQVAQWLGFSTRWVEYRVSEGMPHKIIGGRLRFQRTPVMQWLESREERKTA